MIVFSQEKVFSTIKRCVSWMKGRKNSIINMYHCKTCDINFLVPLKLCGKYNKIRFVCPECKSNKWGHIW
ncbi:MAG: hypothetical protein BV459_08590 [Thermoplasmata archaeon M11B2D]|nr:MAG: hypothetical protein BV459_08590 [Thermoplasmata archaeon M11B2D]